MSEPRSEKELAYVAVAKEQHAEREACANGCVWDNSQQRLRNIA